MKIGIVELHEKNHHSMIYNWVVIANKNSWDVTLFTTLEVFENVKQEIKTLSYNLILEKGSRFCFLKEIKEQYRILGIENLIFLSITSSFLELLFVSFRDLRFGLTVHNANAWFYKNKIRKISHYFKRLVRLRLIKNCSFIFVNSENMKAYIEDNFKYRKPISVLPFSLKRSNKKLTGNSGFTVIYPGSVNVKRKNYENFMCLAKDNPNDNFIVLGSCVEDKESKEVFARMRRIKNIKVFSDYVTLAEFDNFMLRSDILFSDIVVDFNLSDLSEIYGLSKDSGISYLMIQFNKTAFINSDFINFKELRTETIYFKNYEELRDEYNNIKSNKDRLENIHYAINQNCQNYNLDYFSKKIEDFLA